MGTFNWVAILGTKMRIQRLLLQDHVPAIMRMGNIMAAGKYGMEKNGIFPTRSRSE